MKNQVKLGYPLSRTRMIEGVMLVRSASEQYRGVVARNHYFGQDSGQIQFAVKELIRFMAKLTLKDRAKLKKLVRFLK